MNCGDQSTPRTDYPLGGELFIQLEDRRTGAKIDKLCVTPVTVGRLIAVVGDAIGLAVETACRLTFLLAVKQWPQARDELQVTRSPFFNGTPPSPV